MTAKDPRTALRAALLDAGTYEQVAEQVRVRAARLRQTAPVTLAQLTKLVDAELSRFFGDPPTPAAAE